MQLGERKLLATWISGTMQQVRLKIRGRTSSEVDGSSVWKLRVKIRVGKNPLFSLIFHILCLICLLYHIRLKLNLTPFSGQGRKIGSRSHFNVVTKKLISNATGFWWDDSSNAHTMLSGAPVKGWSSCVHLQASENWFLKAVSGQNFSQWK